MTVNYATLIGDNVKVQDHTWLAGNMRIGDVGVHQRRRDYRQ